MDLDTFGILVLLPSCIFKRISGLIKWPKTRLKSGQNGLKSGQNTPIFRVFYTNFRVFLTLYPCPEVSVFGENTLIRAKVVKSGGNTLNSVNLLNFGEFWPLFGPGRPD